MAIDFNTRDYELSHGKSPRGRGSWAFFFDRSMQVGTAFWTPGSTTYAEAKKLARAEAKRRFGDNAGGEIFVGS